jgi:hypothetical protein
MPIIREKFKTPEERKKAIEKGNKGITIDDLDELLEDYPGQNKEKKKPIKQEPESSSESESDTEVSPAIKKRQDLLKSLMKKKDKYTKAEYQEIYKAILGDKIDSKKDFKKVISNIKQITEIKETMKTNKENNPKTKLKINSAELEQKAIKEIDDFLFVELDKIQKIDSGKKQLSESEIKKIIGEYKKIKTKIDKVVKKIVKNDMKGKGIPKELGDLIHIDIGSHNTKGEGIKGKGSILGNIGMAYGNAWNQKAIKGSPEDKFLKFFHNDFIPTAMKPIDKLAPPVGELGHAGFDALKEHQGYGLKSGRGKGFSFQESPEKKMLDFTMGQLSNAGVTPEQKKFFFNQALQKMSGGEIKRGRGFNDAQKTYLMDFFISKASEPQFQSKVMNTLTPSEETKTFLKDYTAKKIAGQGRGRGRPRKNTGLGYKP